MGGSGNKQMIINTRERLVSTDVNRLQAFVSRDIAEMFRYMLDVPAADMDGGGIETISGATAAPMQGTIVNGLRVEPQIASTVLLIRPGVVGVLNPDPAPVSPDDSPYKWIVDPGVPFQGVLSFTPNSSGSTRIDVIEAARADVVLEVDNRDQFNASTGLFTPVSVNKVHASQLTYRIRTGTPGGGYPGAASGWLPLAVARVPNNANTWDDCQLWDVRPLASDRARQPFNVQSDLAVNSRALIATDQISSAQHELHGFVDITVNGQRGGGHIETGFPTNAGFIDLSDSNNYEPGAVFSSNTLWYLWFCFPFGLPRWARYTDASFGFRKPKGPRGIPVVTNKGVLDMRGQPSSAVALPTVTGLGGSTNVASLAAAGWTDFLGNIQGVNCAGGIMRAIGIRLALTGSTSTGATTFVLTDGTHYPANARRIRIQISSGVTVVSGTPHGNFTRNVTISGKLDGTFANGITMAKMGSEWLNFTGADEFDDVFECDISLIPTYDWTLGLKQRAILFSHGVATGTLANTAFIASSPNISIVGWDLGP